MAGRWTLPNQHHTVPRMVETRTLSIHLTEYLLWRVRRGKHPFLAELVRALEARGWRITWRGDGLDERLASAARPGYTLFYEDAPVGPRCLTLRRSYFDPFWQIEASAKRWEWDVARASFDPEAVDGDRAAHFVKFWRGRMPLPPPARGEGFVYVPLQGRLLTQRSFQSRAPVDMVREIAKRERTRDIVLTLHPGETYSPHEREAVDRLIEDPRIHLSDSPMTDLLPKCDYVACENSSVALKGFFLNKPALLFAEIDFHHIAASVPKLGMKGAFEALGGPAPDYARYLFWFFQHKALNFWRPEFGQRVTERLQAHGWPA